MPTKQLQNSKTTSPTLRPCDDVIHRQMLRQEMRPTPIAVPALSAAKQNLRLAQRRRRFTIRPLRNIPPSDSLNTPHQPKLIPSPLLHQPHRQRRQIDTDPLPVQPLRRDASRRTSTERVTPYSSSSGPGYAVNATTPDKMATLRAPPNNQHQIPKIPT